MRNTQDTQRTLPQQGPTGLGLRVLRVGALALTGLLLAAGCDHTQFRFASSEKKFAIPGAEAGAEASACFADLAAVDAEVRPDYQGWEQMSAMGSLSEQAFRKQERERQRQWDQHYCRRQADCRALSNPAVPAVEIAESVELCLNDRAHRRVAMKL